MNFAYADPPYLGCAVKLYGDHPEAAVYDDPAGHGKLIERMRDEFPDGWALSMTSGNLHDLLPLCPKESRVMAWVKPFAAFKPNVGVAYAWEPVIVMGGRRRTREQPTVRDWCAVNITLKRGFTGAKPSEFVFWLMDVLNVHEGDTVADLFPGSGAVQVAVDAFFGAMSGQVQDGLFATEIA
ncbi:hypothetical protein [Paraburkholderia sediminicola]|uniref:hypothetical protein n=1 Tax=Paraburkholderia sediminicola TaxID=458836 RepID=UPI0038B8F147